MGTYVSSIFGVNRTIGHSSVNILCENEWELYKTQIGELDQNLTVILDDRRHLDLITTKSNVLAQFSGLIENTFLGCKEVISRDIHDDFVEAIVKRVEQIVLFDYSSKVHHPDQTIKMFRFTEDTGRDRQTNMIFVMVIRIAHVRAELTDDEEEAMIKWESCLRLRMHSHVTESVSPAPNCEIQLRNNLPIKPDSKQETYALLNAL